MSDETALARARYRKRNAVKAVNDALVELRVACRLLGETEAGARAQPARSQRGLSCEGSPHSAADAGPVDAGAGSAALLVPAAGDPPMPAGVASGPAAVCSSPAAGPHCARCGGEAAADLGEYGIQCCWPCWNADVDAVKAGRAVGCHACGEAPAQKRDLPGLDSARAYCGRCWDDLWCGVARRARRGSR